MDKSAKILLLGKTGVGKSAFINYFVGREVAKSEQGKPITLINFKPYIAEGFEHSNKITICDTKGLESLNANEQIKEIINEIVQRNKSDNIFDWFHTIFYCISFSNPRFEDFEIKFINTLQKELKQHIHIIITHCDNNKATQENILKMKEKIKSDLVDTSNIEIFEVVSIKKKKLIGKSVEPSGKEVIAERVFDLLLEDIAYKLSNEYAEKLRNSIEQIVYRAFSKLDDFIENKFKLGTLIDLIKDPDETEDDLNTHMEEVFSELEDDMDDIIEKTDEEFSEILKPAAELYSSYYGVVSESDFVEYICPDLSDFDWIETDLYDVDSNKFMSKIMPNISKYMDDNGNLQDDNLSFFEKIGMFAGGIGDIFNLKENFKNILREFKYDFLYNVIPSQSEIPEDPYKKIIDILK